MTKNTGQALYLNWDYDPALPVHSFRVYGTSKEYGTKLVTEIPAGFTRPYSISTVIGYPGANFPGAGSFDMTVVAVDANNKESAPSNVEQLTLVDTQPAPGPTGLPAPTNFKLT